MNESTQFAPPPTPRAVQKEKKVNRGIWHQVQWALAVLAALALGYALFVRPFLRTSDKDRRGARSSTVMVAAARTADLDTHLFALGTITPVSTVTVRSRVDGQLDKIYFQEGQYVEAGAPLAEIDPRPFEAQKQQAEAQLAKDNALLENARADLDRYNALLAENSISQQQTVTQKALVRQYQAAVGVDEAQIQTAALQLTYAHIHAPVSGRVGLRLVDAGNMIHASDPTGIVVITQLRPISVLFSLPQEALPKVLAHWRSGQMVALEAFDRDSRQPLAKGKLITIDNEIDPSTGTIKMRGEFPNEDESLFPNQFVNIQLTADHLSGATVIPSAALQHGAVGYYVYVVTDDGGTKVASVRTVHPGPADGALVAITDGIKPGEFVVTDGVDKLREGATVDVLSPENPPSGPEAKPSAKGKGSHAGGHHKRDSSANP